MKHKNIIEQAAKDYDIELHIVKAIYDKHRIENFYIELEYYIKNRSERVFEN